MKHSIHYKIFFSLLLFYQFGFSQVDVVYNNLVWSENSCGGGVYNMEQRAKATAYDLGCGHTVICEIYCKEDVILKDQVKHF